MTNVKRKNIVTVIVVALFYLLYLWKHFSTVGAGITAISILWLAIFNFATINEKNYGVVSFLGRYFGVSICNFMLVTLFSLGAQLRDVQYIFKAEWLSITISFVVLIICAQLLNKLHQNSKYQTKFAYIRKYVILIVGSSIVLFFFIGYSDMTNFTALYWMLVLVALTALIEQIYNSYGNADNKDCVFGWCMINIIVFVAMSIFYPTYTNIILYKLGNIATVEWKWYTIVLIALAAIGLGVYYWIVDGKPASIAYDSKLCLVVAVDLLMIPIVTSNYTTYSIVIFMALALLNIVAFFWNNGKINIFKKSFPKSDVAFVLGVLGLVITHISFVNGSIYSALIFFAAIFCVWQFVKAVKGMEGILFWEFIVIGVGLWSVEGVYRSCHAKETYIYMIFVAVLATIALIAVNIKNERKHTADKAVKAVIVVCAAILFIFPVKKLGVDYDIEIDNKISQLDPALSEAVGETNNIVITLEARGKKNKIAKCYYYWDSNVKNRVEVATEDKASVEIVLPAQNGCLHMYSEDKYGVSSTKETWFEFNELSEKPITEEGNTETAPEGGTTEAVPEQTPEQTQ